MDPRKPVRDTTSFDDDDEAPTPTNGNNSVSSTARFDFHDPSGNGSAAATNGPKVKKRVTFGTVIGSYYETSSDVPVEAEPAPDVKNEAPNPDAKEKSSFLGTDSDKLHRYFNVPIDGLDSLRSNIKIMKFFGEVPPPDSYRQHQMTTARCIYDKYLKPGSICEIFCSPQTKDTIQAKIAAENFAPNLFDHAQKHALGFLEATILPSYLGNGVTITTNNAVPLLVTILEDDAKRTDFLAFCKRNHWDNEFNFLISVEKYRLLRPPQTASDGTHGADEQLRAANDLYERYVKPGAPREISTPPEIKQHIQERIEGKQIDSKLFNESQKYVLSIMRVDILPKFLEMLPNTQVRSLVNPNDEQWTLSQIFKDKEMTKAFLKFCKSIYSEENALFYLAVEKFKVIPATAPAADEKSTGTTPMVVTVDPTLDDDSAPFLTSKARRRHSLLFPTKYGSRSSPGVTDSVERAREVYDTYVKPGCMSEVSAPPGQKADIQVRLENNDTPPDLYDDMQKHILNVMFVDIYPKYLESLAASGKKQTKAKQSELQALLSDKEQTKNLVKFCKSIHAQENVQFYLAVEKYRQGEAVDGAEDDGTDSEDDYEDFANHSVEEELKSSPEAEATLSLAHSLSFPTGYMPRSTSKEDALIPRSPSSPKMGLRRHRKLKSIVKPLDMKSVQLEERLRAIRLRHEKELAVHVERLKKGEVLTKYNARYKPIKRKFAVSADGSELMWGKASQKQLPNRCDLTEIVGMYYGPFSKRFRYFDCSVGKSWLCFVVECEKRTFDVVCENVEQLTAWFLGIQHLAPLNATRLSKGGLYWARANMKIDKMAYFQNTTPIAIWLKLLNEARKAIILARRHGKKPSAVVLDI